MKVWVDDIYYETNEESTIFQFCQSKNINVPCFCYHEKLSIAGNCRICLVEANNALVVSCAMPLLDEMRVSTNSARVRKARENVMEFLLVNHPLDCPICDQGGECDLQDLSMVFGSDRGRFYEQRKRSVDNLYCCGPLIKTVMTRCIHCTRCVRFISEISGTFDLGVLGRGNSMEIGTYIENFVFDELSANIIDLCPVGALTSMPYAFSARPWEMSTYESIDIFDAVGSSINVSISGNKLMRIIPVLNENINEEWITNKARFAYDSLNIQRLAYPKLRLHNKLIILSWAKAFDVFISFLHTKPIRVFEGIIGNFTDLDTACALKDFFNGLGSSNLNFEDSFAFNSDFRMSYLLNTTIVSLESASIIVLLGTNLRLESPLLNSRLRKNYLLRNKHLNVYSFGLALDYSNFPIKNFGNSLFSFKQLLEGKTTFFKETFFSGFINRAFLGVRPKVDPNIKFLVGLSLLNRYDGNAILPSLSYFLSKSIFSFDAISNCVNIISPFLGRLSAAEVGFLPGINSTYSRCSDLALSYYCGVDIHRFMNVNQNSFFVYQGIFKNNSVLYNRANLILPTTSFVERTASYINLEGRLRTTTSVIFPFRFVFHDRDIMRGILINKKAKVLHNFSLLKDFSYLRFFNHIIRYNCLHLFDLQFLNERLSQVTGLSAGIIIDNVISFNINYLTNIASDNFFFNSLINRTVNNYYSSDIFSKNSKVMSLSSMKITFSNFSIK